VRSCNINGQRITDAHAYCTFVTILCKNHDNRVAAMRRPRWPLHAGRFVQLYCSLTWDDSYASSCSGCGPPGAANMRNDMYHGELGNSAATKLHTTRASSKTCLVIFSRSVGVNLLLNCYTVAATQTLSISPSLPSSHNYTGIAVNGRSGVWCRRRAQIAKHARIWWNIAPFLFALPSQAGDLLAQCITIPSTTCATRLPIHYRC